MVNVPNAGYVPVYLKTSNALFYLEFKDEFEEFIQDIFVVIQNSYRAWKNFKSTSNVPLNTIMNIPESIMEQLNLQIPKLVQGQPVMIESIQYNINKRSPQTVFFRTLRKFEER